MIKFIRAIVAGLVGSVVTVVLAVVAVLAWRVAPDVGGLAAYWNEIGLSLGVAATFGGAALIGGILIAVGYAFAFEFITRKAGWLIGAAFGVLQAVGAWLGIGVLAWWFPVIASMIATELAFVFNSTFAIALLILVHVVYGAIVGIVYGRPIHSPDVETRVLWQQLYPAKRAQG